MVTLEQLSQTTTHTAINALVDQVLGEIGQTEAAAGESFEETASRLEFAIDRAFEENDMARAEQLEAVVTFLEAAENQWYMV